MFNPYLLYIKLAIVGILVAAIGVQTIRLSFSEKRVEVLTLQKKDQDEKIAKQNAAVAALVQAGEDQKKRMDEAAKFAKEEAVKNSKRLIKIADSLTPTDCSGAAQWAKGQALNLKEVWK
jgi:predicted Holliday junction resolvase-like endonuclease